MLTLAHEIGHMLEYLEHAWEDCPDTDHEYVADTNGDEVLKIFGLDKNMELIVQREVDSEKSSKW